MLNEVHRVLPRVAAALVVLAGTLSAQVASGHADINQGVRPFNTRYEATLNGSILLIGNNLLACPPGSIGFEHGTSCEAAQTPSGLERGIDNNNFDMRYLDVDGDPATFNASTAQLSLPAGSDVTFAGLYWGAFSNKNGEPVAPQRVVVKLRTPGSADYVQLIATQLDDVYIGGQGNAYQGFVDVTQRVKAAGSGLYTVADVTAVQGANRYAGWVMVVAYNNLAEDLRNLVIYDGFKFDPEYKPIVIPLSGFLTPATGPVSVTLGIYGSDGDRGNAGDQMLLNNALISNAANPPDNPFNSSITNKGANVTDRVPAYVNNMNIDVDLLDASNILPNNATAATLTISATQEKFLPGLVTFSTLVFQPAIQIEARVNDVNSGVVNAGDTLEYTIIMTNTGSIASTDTRLAVTLPAGTTFVPGTLNIANNAGGAIGLQTDAPGDDLGEAGGGVLNFRLGAGAGSAVGGSFAYNASATVTYRVIVTGSIANQLVLANRSDVVFRSAGNATAVLTSTNMLNVVATPKVRLMAPIVSKP